MKDNYYITTPIYYVNDVPHIGHAYTSIAADVCARFMRLLGHDVFLLTGTDEHGQKVENSALKRGIPPQQFCNTNAQNFNNLMHLLNISNDDFIRTTEVRHKKAVHYFWQQLLDEGSIYLGSYSGWYSVRDESFYSELELTADKKAPTGADVEWVEEPSYFFALSKWQDKLLQFYDENPDFILPKSRRNEIINFVKGGLHDISISRTSFKWGVNIPNNEDHVIYVWLDALVNYISALGYPESDKKLEAFWPANVHIVGKDILRFHAVYWPAFLMAAGLKLPEKIVAHGWWTNEGEKISKSLGNVIDPIELVNEFGVDQVRYFLMREIIFGNDGNYSRINLINRINTDLANKIGNLMQRTMAFIYKNNNAQIPFVSKDYITQMYLLPLFDNIDKTIEKNVRAIKFCDISSIMDNIMYIVDMANAYIDFEAPWKLKNDNPKRMGEILYTLLEALRYISIMLQPFVPEAASKMLDQLKIPQDQRSFEHLNKNYAVEQGQIINTPVVIFPRIIC